MYEGCGGYDEGDADDDFGTDGWVSTGDIIKTQPGETSINNNRLILSSPHPPCISSLPINIKEKVCQILAFRGEK